MSLIFFQTELYIKLKIASVLRYPVNTMDSMADKSLDTTNPNLKSEKNMAITKNLITYEKPKSKKAFLKCRIPLCFVRS
ncbi:MAG: hypothetical protein WC916_00110 [Candidatus Woesearchaeota archaeon]